MNDRHPRINSKYRDPSGTIWKVASYGMIDGERYVWLVADDVVSMVPLVVFWPQYELVEA